MAGQKKASGSTITRGKSQADTAHLKRQFERLAAHAISLFKHQQHIGEAHPAASGVYRCALTDRTRRRWALPHVMSPFTGAEATHLEVHLSVEDGGRSSEARLSWIVPYADTGEDASD